jgi:hypothetical protein|nr:MAG TPA: major tail protein [Caudoviricetes sp.]
MTVTKERVERKLMTGIGAGYLQKVKTEATSESGLTYEDKVYEVFAIDKVAFKGQIKNKSVYLSNKKLRDIAKFSSVEMTVDIGFFPEGFVEEMSGMIKLADGVYVQGDSPRYKYFRWSFPVTDEDGGEVIFNFPVCQLKHPDFNAETETDEKKENIAQVTIEAFPVIGSDNKSVYSKIDLTTTKLYDREKLLLNGFYDAETLKACIKDGQTDSTVVPRA